MEGVLTKLRPKTKFVNVIGFDTEDDSKGHPFSCAFYSEAGEFYTESMNEAIEYVYNTETPSVFVAHNLEYDIGNLFKKCDFAFVSEMVYSGKLLKVSLLGSKHIFINSSSFFNGSLKQMGKIVGLEKLSGDGDNKIYNIRDAEIVWKFMQMINEKSFTLGISAPITIGQLSMSVFRSKFLGSDTITWNSKEAVKEAYYGGRVEMFFRGVVNENVTVTDIKSSYPDVMRNKEYPDTNFIESNTKLSSHRFGIGKFRVLVPENCFIPVLPFVSEEGKLFFPTGEFTGWWTYAEVRHAVSNGTQILEEYEGGQGTNAACRPFFSYINFFWDERKAIADKLKQDPSNAELSFLNMFYKLLMNNLYGKFSSHKDAVNMFRVKPSKSKLEKMKGAVETIIGPFYGYKTPRETPPKTANYLWGTYITSYARISLHEKLLVVHRSGNKILYCDTDSIMYSGKNDVALNFGSGLGQMDKEVFDYAIFRQSKGYLLCDKTETGFKIEKSASKGVPVAYADDYLVRGAASFFKPNRLKEALIRSHAEINKNKIIEELGINYWNEVTKEMRAIYIKRQPKEDATFLDGETLYPVNVAKIEKLCNENYGPVVDMEKELPMIEGKPRIPWVTSNRIVPDFETRTNEKEPEEGFFSAQRVHFLKKEECIGLDRGEHWFTGKILGEKKGKFGNYIVCKLEKYLNENVTGKNILAGFPVKFLSKIKLKENFSNKTLEFIMNEKYIGDSGLNVSVSEIKKD